jgi:hypothetical protein
MPRDGFESAQRAYDNQEPPEVPECLICDGAGKVEVSAVAGCEGKVWPWPSNQNRPEVDCPFCVP